MAEWVEKGSLKGPPGEIPDTSDFLKIEEDGYLNKTGFTMLNPSGTNFIDGNVVNIQTSDTTSSISFCKDNDDIAAYYGINANKRTVSFNSWVKNSEDSAKTLYFGVNAEEEGSYIGTQEGPVDKIYASDVPTPDTANGTRVPNLNNVRSLISAESSARDKADKLLQEEVDAKMHPDDVVAGKNVSVSVGDDGRVTISAETGLPEGGTDGQVLTKTSDSVAWEDIPDYVDATTSASGLMSAADKTKLDGLDDELAGKSDVGHTHNISDVNGLQDALNDKVDSGDFTLGSLGVTATATELNYMDGVTSNVQTQFSGKANVEHEHDASDVTSGVFDAARIPSITDDKITSISADKITGTIPSDNLPSYVDDVVEVNNYSSLPPTGESGKIYVDKQTNKTYRWGGSEYVEISESLAIGETSSTAFRGDYGKTAYQHAQSKGSEFASGLYKIATNSEGHVTGAVAVQKSDITALGIPGENTDTTYTAGSGLSLSGTEFGVADGGIIGRHLDDNCVMARNIVVNSVTSDKIPALAITTPKLVDNAVTAIKMADDAVATRSIQNGAVTAEKIAEGVIPEAVDYDVATTEADGLMSKDDKAALDNLKTNAVTTDASGYVQKSPFKFKNSDGSVEMNFTSKTETSLDLELKTKTGTDVVTISADNLFGEASGGIAMGAGATFDMGGKEVNGIVDAVGEGADGTKLATDKAVKDAIAAIEIPDPLPTGGTDGQVLTKTADGEAWEDIPDYENATTEYDGLMSAADKTKLDGIQAGANNYVHPASASGAKASGFYKVQTDANGHVIGAVNVVKGDITALGIPAQDTTYVDATGSASGLMSAADKTKLDGMDTALAGKSDVGHTHEIANVNGLQTALDGKAASGHKHDASDITTGTMSVDRLPSITDDKISSVSAEKITGTIPSENLPSYVDDVVEVENHAALPPTGEAGKIYVDKETNKTYRWGGSDYVEISASLALGETSATAFRGDYGKVAYDHAQAKGSEFTTGFYRIATNAEGHVTGATAVTKGDITALGVPAQDTTYVDATTSASGLMSAADKTKLDGIQAGADKLPDGGTVGQVLTKTSDGEAWQDAAIPDNVLTVGDDGAASSVSGSLKSVDVAKNAGQGASMFADRDNMAGITVNAKGASIKIQAEDFSPYFSINEKSVSSITDDATSGSTSALATAKAVKAYVDSKTVPQASATQYGTVKFASDEDFKAYMGIS